MRTVQARDQTSLANVEGAPSLAVTRWNIISGAHTAAGVHAGSEVFESPTIEARYEGELEQRT